MKRHLTLYLMILLSISSCSTQKWISHKNKQHNFTIKYPENWVLSASKEIPEQVFFIHETPSDSLEVLTNIQIKITPHFDISLDLRTELKENEWKQSKTYKNVNIISKKKIKFNGMNAYELICLADVSNIKTKWKQIIFINKLSFIEISITSNKDKYDKNQRITEKIISSFSLQNK